MLGSREEVEQLSLIKGMGMEGYLVRNLITRPVSGIQRHIITCPCSERFSCGTEMYPGLGVHLCGLNL